MRSTVGVLVVFLCLWPKFVFGRPYFDERCNKNATTYEMLVKLRNKLTLKNYEYDTNNRIVCHEKDQVLPEYSTNDDWPHLLELISKLTRDRKASCTNFPQVIKSVYKSLSNPFIFRNCTKVVEFCDQTCETGCPHVSPSAYSSKKSALDWAQDTFGIKEGKCAEEWIRANIQKAKSEKQAWIQDIRFMCDHCFRGSCSNAKAKNAYTEMLEELSEIPGVQNPEKIVERLCLVPATMGLFDATAFHLQQRFAKFDPELSIKLKIQNEWIWIGPLLYSWVVIIHVLLYIFPESKLNIFNRTRDQDEKEKADTTWQYLLRWFKMRGKRSKARRARKTLKKGKVITKKVKKVRMARPPATIKLPTGQIVGKKYGPEGRGGRKRN